MILLMRERMDDDLFWEHSQNETAYDGVENLDGNTTTSLHDDSRKESCKAFGFECGDGEIG